MGGSCDHGEGVWEGHVTMVRVCGRSCDHGKVVGRVM